MTGAATPPVRAPAADPVAEALELLAADMERFNAALLQALEPQREYLTAAEYDLYRLGKKIRPLLLLLSARLASGAPPEVPVPLKAVQAAVSTEMLHVATLIHDDIVDGAPLRRGLPSVHAARGTELAILVGDLQFVQALRCFTDAIDTQSDMGLVRMVLGTAFRICCGEIDELTTDTAAAPHLLRERYLRTIERKTAALFGLACECGAALGGGRTRDCRRIGFYGRRVGRAFQIMDDILDLVQPEAEAGKAPGMDLARRRPSLPIVYAMEELGPGHPVTRIVRGLPCTGAGLREGLRAVRRSGGILRAYRDARAQVLEAQGYLEWFPASPYRDLLERIAFHVVDRGYRPRRARAAAHP
jgi:heptaprenyl diphosphate synthase